MLDRLHLWDGRHGALEIFQARSALGGELHSEKNCDPKPDFFSVEIQCASGYDTGLSERTNAPPGNRFAP